MVKKALLVIDVQDEYMDKYPAELLPAMNRIIEQEENNNTEIIYVKNIRRLKSGETSYDFASGLKVCSQNIIYKKTASIFQDTFFREWLNRFQIEHLIMIGIDGCCCVAKSAEDAVALGYKVTIPLHAVGVQNMERFSKKKTLLKKLSVELADELGEVKSKFK